MEARSAAIDAPQPRRDQPTPIAPLLVTVAGLSAVGWVGYHDPEQRPDLFPKCVVHAVTGLDCPACGSTRMAHHLLRGRLRAAWQANPVMMVVGLPLLGWLGTRWIVAAGQGRRPEQPPRWVGYAAAIIAVAWMVFRNTRFWHGPSRRRPG